MLCEPGKKQLSERHCAELRYQVKDAGEKVIRVSKVGKITARRKGRSTVCVMAKNGMGVKVMVRVVE